VRRTEKKKEKKGRRRRAQPDIHAFRHALFLKSSMAFFHVLRANPSKKKEGKEGGERKMKKKFAEIWKLFLYICPLR